MPKTGINRFAQGVAIALLFVMAACETAPPVQEMSDARQAIAVAREAGAEEHAPLQLQEAVDFLQRAEQKLNERDYLVARNQALAAKQRAQDARRAAEDARSSEQR
ncbi:MAG: DUF4398 domain-containing protein [Woeseiaceae bacterium]|nr:DUF4398 domain-containing protein [Woeseiaceae bacterium]